MCVFCSHFVCAVVILYVFCVCVCMYFVCVSMICLLKIGAEASCKCMMSSCSFGESILIIPDFALFSNSDGKHIAP